MFCESVDFSLLLHMGCEVEGSQQRKRTQQCKKKKTPVSEKFGFLLTGAGSGLF